MKAADLLLTQIRTHDANPRRHAAADDDMVASVAAAGVLQAVTVAPAPDSPSQNPADPTSLWVLLAGHRRLDACTKAGLDTIPAVVRDDLLTDAQQLEAMLVENLHREDLTAVEEAHAYEQLQLFGMTRTAIAKATGRNVKTVKARLDLVALPETTQQRLHDGQLTLEQAATLLEVQAEAPDLAADLEKAAGQAYWVHEVVRVKQTLERRRRNRALVAEFKDLHAVACKPSDANWRGLSRFPDALRDPDQHPECLGYLDYGDDSYSAPILVCIDVDAHDLPAGQTPVIHSSGGYHEDPVTRAQRDAEWEERRRADAERRAARAAATETRLRWLHTHIRRALAKPKDRTPLLEVLLPLLVFGSPEDQDGPSRTQIVAALMVASGHEPGELLATNIVGSQTHQDAETKISASLTPTGATLVESTHAAWLTAWADYALTTDLAWTSEDGDTTILTAQLALWTYVTDAGYPLTDVDEGTVARITAQVTEYAADEDGSDLVHAMPTGGQSPCGVHYLKGTFGTDPTCPECLDAEQADDSSEASQ